MNRFVHNDIISLTGRAPRFDLAESIGPDLRLGELLGPGAKDELRLGYATVAGDPTLRAAIAAQHGVEADDVVVTVGGMHALFLTGYILCGRGEEAIHHHARVSTGTRYFGQRRRDAAAAAPQIQRSLSA